MDIKPLRLTDYEYKHSSQDGAFVLGALGFIAEADAGHGHEEHSHCWETQDRTCDHQGTSRLDVGYRNKNVTYTLPMKNRKLSITRLGFWVFL